MPATPLYLPPAAIARPVCKGIGFCHVIGYPVSRTIYYD